MKLKEMLAGALLTCLLTACAGDGNTLIVEGGIGGTGIAVGPITAFGSVWVNGVRYDVSGADFVRDGVAVSGQSNYRIGEIVTVNGTVNADGVSGAAAKVVFSNTLAGVISSVSDQNSQLTVLGQQIRVSTLTILHGFAVLTDLQPGNVVEVSGNRDSQGVINASSISLTQTGFVPGESEQVLKGRVSALNAAAQHFILNGIQVDYSAALLELPGNQPANGQFVTVKSRQLLQDNRLIAATVAPGSEQPEFRAGQEVELEGSITVFRSSTDFSVNSVPVITTAATEFEYGVAADLKLDSVVEVEGVINNARALVAEEISIRRLSSTQETELEGPVAGINAAAQELTLLGNTIVIDNQSILLDESADQEKSIGFSDLRVGDYIEVSGQLLPDGRILALRLDREEAENKLEVTGVCQAIDSAGGKLTIQGVSILTDNATQFQGSADETLSRQQFFNSLTAGQSIVEAEGTPLGDNWMRATKLEVKSP
jgi:hypothetical protein